MGAENPLGQEELHGLAAVADGALPVLGRLATGDELELVRGQPGVLEPDAGALAALAKSGKEASFAYFARYIVQYCCNFTSVLKILLL